MVRIQPKAKKFAEEVTPEGRKTGVEKDDDSDAGNITKPFDPSKIDIKTKSESVFLLMSRIDHEELDLLPDFQRKAGIWDATRKSRLIESVLLRIPLPVIYVAADLDDKWIVVDGLQRLYTLYHYVKKKDFALEKLEFLSRFNNDKFDDLARPMQRRILETEMVVHIIQPATPRDVTRTVFKRINTGGLSLSPQEIRHALYQGKATKLLAKLAESEAFLTATDNSIKDDRMVDRECILRFLAFTIFGFEKYETEDLDSFLCKALEKINGQSTKDLKALEELFVSCMQFAHDLFGMYCFRKLYERDASRYPINKALFESISVSLAMLNKNERIELVENRKLVIKKFIDLMNGIYKPPVLSELKVAFEDSISIQTSSIRNVKARFTSVRALFADVLDRS